jgi:hypothetical protein
MNWVRTMTRLIRFARRLRRGRLLPACQPRDVAARLNRLAIALDYAHEELSELRHGLGVADRLDAYRRRTHEARE